MAKVKDEGVLQYWLKRVLAQDLDVEPLQGDASSRIYYRVKDDKDSYILMVAPLGAEFESFIKIASLLKQQNLSVPKFHAIDEELGLILMSDFGDKLYLKELNPMTVDKLYKDAIDAIILMQKIDLNNKNLNIDDYETVKSIKKFDNVKMLEQLNLFKSWYLEKHLKLSIAPYINIFEKSFTYLIEQVDKIPKVFTHVDYHSRNLLVVNDKNPGLLDFQDAMYGPCTYDLLSLLNDCYVDWGEDVINKFIAYYKKQAIMNNIIEHVDIELFMDWFDYSALQRHLKNLGVFCRLNYRDSKDNYLQYIPRLLMYISRILERHPELSKLKGFFDDVILPISNEKIAV